MIKKTNLTTDSTQGLIGYSYKFNDDHRESRDSIKRIKLSDIVRLRDCSRRLLLHGYCTAREIAVVDEQRQIFTARRYIFNFIHCSIEQQPHKKQLKTIK